MKKKFNKILGTVLIAVFLVGSAPAYAAEKYAIENCTVLMDSFLKWRTLEFNAFLDLTFQSKENNSSLVAAAIQGFIDYKRIVFAELSKFKASGTSFSTNETNPSIAGQIGAYDQCLSMVDEYVAMAKDRLKEKVLTTGKIKQSTPLLEKYQSINSKLSDMNLLIAKIVSAFETFKNKLPGYLRDCITK